MADVEYVMSHLRQQVRDLQALVNYLEEREAVGQEDQSYVHFKLTEVVRRLKEAGRFWLN